MKFKDIFLTANSNLFRSKLRTILTIIAIFIGAFTLTLTSGLGSGISSYIDKQVANIGHSDDIMITAKNESQNGPGGSDTPPKYEAGKVTGSAAAGGPDSGTVIVLTDKDIDALKANKDLKDVLPTFNVNPDFIQGANGDQFMLTVSSIGANATLDLAAGKQLVPNATDNQVVLPINFVSPLGFSSPEDAVGKTVTVAVTDATGVRHLVNATVVGVQQKGLASASGVAFNDTLRNTLYDIQSVGLPAASKSKYQSATAKMTGDTSDEAHVAAIKSNLESQGYSGTTVADQLGTIKTVINVITFVLNGFAVIALLAASFGIVNTLLMSVQERTKEIGLMKAMGMRSNRIFALFSLEAILIGFWGSLVGVGVAMVVGKVINVIVSNGLLKNLPGFSLLAFTPKSIALIMLLIMGIAFLAGALPARRAAKQNPIDALRYE